VTSTVGPSSSEPELPEPEDVAQLLETFQQRWVSDVTTGSADELPSLLSRAAARVLHVDGAALCVQTAPGSRLPLGASDPQSSTAERLQFTAGEGPCFEALAQQRPVEADQATMRQRWPVLAVLHEEATAFRGGVSVPLFAGATCFGALDLYLTRPEPVDGPGVAAAQAIARVISETLLETLASDTALPEADTTISDSLGGWLDTEAVRRRREVWVAVGMANLALGLRREDGLATLRAHAVVRGQSLDALAHDVVFGHVDLESLHEDA
jgi:hypothetical protein